VISTNLTAPFSDHSTARPLKRSPAAPAAAPPIIITESAYCRDDKIRLQCVPCNQDLFINEIADICEALGADVKEVAVGMGYDKRIGSAMLMQVLVGVVRASPRM